VETSPVKKAQRIVPAPTLCFSDPALGGLRIRLDEDVATIGRREDNAYVVADPRVSRVHAEIRKECGSIIVTDLGSASGTTVDGNVITGPTIVRHGGRIGLGPVSASLEDPAAFDDDDNTMVLTVHKIDTGPRLSPRQQQVLELVAEGMTNAEVGAQLGITERTVKAYAQELYDKLGVRNRAGAVAQGHKHELI
jgi:DNA-binding CsgD family transcriptional regulator